MVQNLTERIPSEYDGPEFDANMMQRLCEDKRAEFLVRRQFQLPEKGVLVFALQSHEATTRSEMTIEMNEPLFVCYMRSKDSWMCISLRTNQCGILPREAIFERNSETLSYLISDNRGAEMRIRPKLVIAIRDNIQHRRLINLEQWCYYAKSKRWYLQRQTNGRINQFPVNAFVEDTPKLHCCDNVSLKLALLQNGKEQYLDGMLPFGAKAIYYEYQVRFNDKENIAFRYVKLDDNHIHGGSVEDLSRMEVKRRKNWKKDSCDYFPMCSNEIEPYQKDIWKKLKLASSTTRERPEKDEIEPIREEAVKLFEQMSQFPPPSTPSRESYSWQEQRKLLVPGTVGNDESPQWEGPLYKGDIVRTVWGSWPQNPNRFRVSAGDKLIVLNSPYEKWVRVATKHRVGWLPVIFLVPTFEEESDETIELREKFDAWWEQRKKRKGTAKKVNKTEIPLERVRHLPNHDMSYAEAIQNEQQGKIAKEQLFFTHRQEIDQDYWGATTIKSLILPAGVMKTVEVGLGLSSFRGTPQDDFTRAFFTGSLILSPLLNFEVKTEIYAQECVARFNDGVALIKLWNTGDKHIHLKPGTKIADASAFVWTREDDDTLAKAIADELVYHRSEAINELSDEDEDDNEVCIKPKDVPGNLTPELREKVAQILNEFKGVIPTKNNPIGHCSLYEHEINTGEAKPISVPPHHMSLDHRKKCSEQIREYLENGSLEPSNSSWAAPVCFVKKKDGTLRLVCDYRRLNAVTVDDKYPLPRIEQILDAVGDSRVFSTMDLLSGFNQIFVRPADREKTAIITPDGLFQWRRMCFGIKGAPATFQRMMDAVLAGIKWKECLVYIDDVFIYSPDMEEHLQRLRRVLQRLEKAGLTIKLKKCLFCQESVTFLGHVINSKGIMMDPDKLQAMAKYPAPTTLKQCQTFIGMCSYYRRFIRDFAKIASPLTDLNRGPKKFIWEETQQQAFEELKKALLSNAVLARYNPTFETQLRTDASRIGVGGLIVQRAPLEKDWRWIACVSARVNENQAKKWTVLELELYAVIYAIQRLRPYLEGIKFTVVTDQRALVWIKTMRNPAPRVGRWQLFLDQFDFKVVHKKGHLNSDADALSRNPISPAPPLGEEDIFETPVDSETIVDESESLLLVSAAASAWLDLQICEDMEELNSNKKTVQTTPRTSVRIANKKDTTKDATKMPKEPARTAEVESDKPASEAEAVPKNVAEEEPSKEIDLEPPASAQPIATIDENENAPEVEVIQPSFTPTREEETPAMQPTSEAQQESSQPPKKQKIQILLPLKRGDTTASRIVILPDGDKVVLRFGQTWQGFKGWRDAQLNDEFGKRFISIFEGTAEQPVHKSELARKENLEMHEGVLCRKKNRDGNETLVTYVPASCVKSILEDLHTSIPGVHMGIEKTWYTAITRFWWPKMASDISKFINACVECQRRKLPHTKPPGSLQQPIISRRKFEHIHIDVGGPYTLTTGGNKFVIVAVDAFSKFVIAKAIPDQTAEVTAEFLAEDVVCRVGSPDIITSDRGVNFVSNLLVELYQLMDIKHIKTSSYHPSANGIAESFMKEINNRTAMYLNEGKANWDRQLQWIVWGHNNVIHSTTGYSPNKIVYGEEPRIPIDTTLSHLRNDKGLPTTYGDYCQELVTRIKQIEEKTALKIAISFDKSRDRYNRMHQKLNFEVNDYVWLRNCVRKVGECQKWAPKYLGPYRILEKTGENNYILELPKGARKGTEKVNIERLKRYIAPDHSLNPKPIESAPTQPSLTVEPNPDEEEEQPQINQSTGSIKDTLPSVETSQSVSNAVVDLPEPTGARIRTRAEIRQEQELEVDSVVATEVDPRLELTEICEAILAGVKVSKESTLA